MKYEERYTRPQDKVVYTITPRSTLQRLYDDETKLENDFIGFLVEGNGKTYIPVVVAISPSLPYVWKLVPTNDAEKEEIEGKLRKLFFLQLKKVIKEEPEKLKGYNFLFKTGILRRDDGTEEITTNFPEFDNDFEKTIKNFEKELEK